MADKSVKNVNSESIRKENSKLIEKIENAYKLCKLSEVYLEDVEDDYGKQKIATLRLKFARHELLNLLEKAREQGIKLKDNDMIMSFFHSDPRDDR
jgi:hypothetical protein